MTVQEVKSLYHANPFRPFKIHLSDGRAIPVKQPEYILPDPTGRTVIVYQPDGSFHIIELLLVSALEVGPPRSKVKNN